MLTKNLSYLFLALFILGCNAESNHSNFEEFEKFSIHNDTLKIVVIDSTYKVISNCQVSLTPPNCEISVFEIQYIYPKYNFYTDNEGVIKITKKDLEKLHFTSKTIIEGHVLIKPSISYFEVLPTAKLLILRIEKDSTYKEFNKEKCEIMVIK